MALNSCNSVGQISGTKINSSVTLTKTGGTLIYSNNPETITNDLADPTKDGVYLYRDNTPGRSRAFFYHLNKSGSNIKIRVELKNTSGANMNIWQARHGTAISSYYQMAGATAWQNYLGTSASDNYVTTIANGATYVIQETASIPDGSVGVGIIDFVCTNSSTGAAVGCQVTIYAYQSSVKSTLTAATLKTSGSTPYGPSYTGQVRGTFSHCSRTASIVWRSSNGSQYLRVGQNFLTSDLTNEYESGVDATNSKTVTINGNYGVDYTLTYTLIDDKPQNTVYGYIQDGFPNVYILQDNGSTGLCASSSTTDAWNYDTTILNGSTQTKTIWYTLAGGDASPVDLYWA